MKTKEKFTRSSGLKVAAGCETSFESSPCSVVAKILTHESVIVGVEGHGTYVVHQMYMSGSSFALEQGKMWRVERPQLLCPLDLICK